jgi:alanine racemase
MLSLYVDSERWWRHLRATLELVPGVVPVIKGNGYGLGRAQLAEVSEKLGVDTVAVGTYPEVADVSGPFTGSVLVLSPWRSFEPAEYGSRLVHTVGRLEDLPGLVEGAPEGDRPRVVLELMTSMRRHGFDARKLREAAKHLDGVTVEGFALHLPMSHGSHLSEVRTLMNHLVASGIDARRVYVSHLTDAEMTSLRASYGDFELRPRVGTRLWLGDRGALSVRATILDSHEVERGDVFGYRGRTAPKHGHIVIVSGGTAHGIGLEAPTGGATLKDRAATIAKGGLDAAGFVRSPFTITGKQRLFAEPPHMQASMLFVPNGTEIPPVGSEVEVRVRFTATSFDRTVLS